MNVIAGSIYHSTIVQDTISRPYFGLDLSKWQLSWRAALAKAAGVDFVFLRAGVGPDYTDPLYAAFEQQAITNGIPYGAYLYYYPASNPEKQAERLWRSAGERVPPCGFAFDVEVYTSLGDRDQRVGRFYIRLAQLSGMDAYWYSNKSIVDSCYPRPWLRKKHKWIANYRADNGPLMPAILSPLDWEIFQFSSTGDGPVHGCGSPKVDYNTALAIPWAIPAPTRTQEEIMSMVRYIAGEENIPGPSAAWCAMMNRMHQSERGRV